MTGYEPELKGYVWSEEKAYFVKENVASDSLKSYPKNNKSNDAAVQKAMQVMADLEPEQQKHVHDFLAQSLKSHKGGDGIPDDYAAKNRQSLKDAQKKKTMKKELQKEIAADFPEFTPELQDKYAEITLEAAENISARNKLLELFTDNPEFTLLFDEQQIDAAELLAHRIEGLEQTIAAVEADNDAMKNENMRNQKMMREEALFIASSKPACRRRSAHNIAEDLEGVDPENSVLMETAQDQHMDPVMRQRVSYLNQTARTDQSPAAHLLETWEITKTN